MIWFDLRIGFKKFFKSSIFENCEYFENSYLMKNFYKLSIQLANKI